jgi:hypothetical protein
VPGHDRGLDHFGGVVRVGERDEGVGLAVQDQDRCGDRAGIEGPVPPLHHQVLCIAADAGPERLADRAHQRPRECFVLEHRVVGRRQVAEPALQEPHSVGAVVRLAPGRDL